MANENSNVSEEIQKEVVRPAEQVAQSPDTQGELSQKQVEVDNKDYNFKQLRESKQQAEEQRDFYKSQVEQFQNSSQSSSDQGKENESIADDDLIEGHHYKKLVAKIEQMEKSYKRKELESVPERLINRFADFDAVVTKDNIEKLKKTEPELYRTITSTDDLYSNGVAAYKTLKGLGYIKSNKDYASEKEAVKENQKKPLSVQAVGEQSALHEANTFAKGLTPDLKKKLMKEMVDASKGY